MCCDLQEDLKPKCLFLLSNTTEKKTVEQVFHSRGRNPPQWAGWEDGMCPAWHINICVPRKEERKDRRLAAPWSCHAGGCWEERCCRTPLLIWRRGVHSPTRERCWGVSPLGRVWTCDCQPDVLLNMQGVGGVVINNYSLEMDLLIVFCFLFWEFLQYCAQESNLLF